MFVDDYVVFDIETTGLNKDKDFIIEIGALKYRNNILVDEFSYLINPNISLPQIITDITGIKDRDLIGKDTIDVILPKFIEFIEDLPLIAHNNSFDLGFINKNLSNLNLSELNNENIDTLELSKKYLPQMYNFKLETLKKYFNIKQISHRAIGDCHTANYVYQECKKRALVNN